MKLAVPMPDASDQRQRAWPKTIAVIGAAGLIGSGVVYQMAVSGLGSSIQLVDVKENLVKAHAIDIAEAQALAGYTEPELSLVRPSEIDVCSAVDLVIIAASTPETPGKDRHDFLASNLDLLRTIAPAVETLAGSKGIVMILSNPVDILAECLRRITSIEPTRILGYSLNDSVRFQLAIASELQMAPSRVKAQVLGEHGSGQVPMFSQIFIDDTRVELSISQQQRIREDIDAWFTRWSLLEPGRSSGWTTPLGAVHTIELMARGETFPAATWTGGIPGIKEAFAALPVKYLNGEVQRAEWVGNEAEWNALANAVGSVRATADQILQQT